MVRTPPAVQELQEMWVRGFHGESVVRTPPAVQELQEMWVRGFQGASVVRTPLQCRSCKRCGFHP